MKYIIDYTIAESFEYTEEKLAELTAFGHDFDVVEVTEAGQRYLAKNRTWLYYKHEHS